MSTIASEFTKEQLIARINQVTAINKYRISRDPDADGLAMDNELFAIALASLEAEAVGYVDAEKILAERDALNSPVIPDGWVACSERMPTPNQFVLVCNGVWVGMGMHNNSEHLEDDERWQDERHEFIDLLHHPVTHWMPLPAAPRREVNQ